MFKKEMENRRQLDIIEEKGPSNNPKPKSEVLPPHSHLLSLGLLYALLDLYPVSTATAVGSCPISLCPSNLL
jgi:hypothetical protein